MIDTATQALSVALFDDGKLVARHHAIVGRGHAEALLPAIAALPEGGKADHIAVDVGPGSFTGVRIGLAAARALAFAWHASLSGYSAMTLVAAGAREHRKGADDQAALAVAITGGHGELFWQLFDADTLVETAPLVSLPIPILAQRAEQDNIYGSGADILVASRGRGTAMTLYPDSRHYPLLPDTAMLAPRPLYGRGADAIPMASPAAA
ncbi:tRNA (adenosine(37)-N6)-threonylcarbamoyltransferase complex dimerization subunit type 1 TsaB [soil metagenome]